MFPLHIRYYSDVSRLNYFRCLIVCSMESARFSAVSACSQATNAFTQASWLCSPTSKPGCLAIARM